MTVSQSWRAGEKSIYATVIIIMVNVCALLWTSQNYAFMNIGCLMVFVTGV